MILYAVAREVLPRVAHLANVQPAAEYEDDVRVLHGEVAAAITDGSRTPDEERVVTRNEVVRVEAGGDRDLEPLRECDQLVGGAAEANASASVDDRPLRAT